MAAWAVDISISDENGDLVNGMSMDIRAVESGVFNSHTVEAAAKWVHEQFRVRALLDEEGY